ncbi:sce7725 family protein [Vibrio europaeus]|uniref:Sce7725 family protein n=1 Tax=Vibrio europaeus TaxID=300876 RepID=A0AAE7AR76_9VIBR|nr:sce7725 family protein [Vibrio europaeus]QJY35190.1 sce7725 family protein [Vibrio europaeus]
MYLPYFRGKQFELIATRELSDVLSPDLFRPIIEPVRLNLSPLIRTLHHLNERGITPLLVLNPYVGEFKSNHLMLHELLHDSGCSYLPVVVVRGGDTSEAQDLIERLESGAFVLQITGGIDPNSIPLAKSAEFTIVDSDLHPLAIAELDKVVLFGDFFKRRKRNADYPKESSFSHLHASFKNTVNAFGFSDFSVVGGDYLEAGGPAYVVTIHLSYINAEMFGEMFVRHYSSADDGTPTDPAGKFAEALTKLVTDAEDEGIFYDSSALEEFKKLYQIGHFPGLGQVKKLSLKHHVETVCNFLERG